MQSFYILYFFITGIIFGSFYNVVGIRVPNKQLFESQRSYCPHCNHTLKWYELIPVFSFIFQRGKCRSCHKPISILYPAIELFTGILFMYSYIHFGFSKELVVSLLFMSLLAIIVVTDLRYMLIPDKILLFFLPLLVIARIWVPLTPWWSSIVGAVIGVVLLALIIIVSRGGMGGGDMKLFGLLGIVLGHKYVLLAFFLSTLYGTVLSILLIAFGLIERKKPVPFGPFIVLGTITTYFFGDTLINWYLNLFY
ncbi:prepilin peptidase [Radiobacillus sp. PE A8.2]|uniref:prepilin peptidase n=1 Tax=Radiobacillus sp. PE A8.2 TaxID=3380349 RepID=UPI00388D30D8